MAEDFLGQEEQEFDGNAPTAEEAANEAKDTRVWHLADGTEVSKSEFIREQFTEFNLSRKEISEKFDINYRTVYGATVNMTNDAEPAGRGRAAANAKINVTADGDVVSVIEDTTHVNNVAVSDEEAAGLETTEVDRNDWIKEQVENGRSRGDVASALGLSYGVVYGITKEIAGASQRHEVEYNGEMISRSEYIRKLHTEEGLSKAEIAKKLEVDYPVVWSALKSLKSEQEKFMDKVDALAKMADKVIDQDTFTSLIEQLKDLEIQEEESTTDAE